MFDDLVNEAELTAHGQPVSEPDFDTVVVAEHKRKKQKGKREEDLSAYPVEIIEHTMPEEELTRTFPDSYTQLEDDIYKKLEMIPSTFKVYESCGIQAQEFERNNVKISRQVMSNWEITTTERYLSLIYDKIKDDLMKSRYPCR